MGPAWKTSAVPNDLVDRCGLTEILGMLRVRGLSGVLRRVKGDVTRAAITRAEKGAPGGSRLERLVRRRSGT